MRSLYPGNRVQVRDRNGSCRESERDMYYIMKRYFLPEPTWLQSPHWNPVAYATWEEARDAYIEERLSNVRALGVAGYPAADIDIRYIP